MSEPQSIETCIRDNLDNYFRDLDGTDPTGLYDMLVKLVEKPLLDVVMSQSGQNQSRTPRDLPGQTATIVGWGPIGQKLSSLLQALGLKVVAVRQHAGPQSPLQADAVERVTFEQLQQVLPRTDWLILACPLTDKTRQLVNVHALAALPKGAHLINVARGEVVDQSALVAALQSGHLGGAFLDVFQHEPLQRDSPLWAMPQVMVTPHAAGHSDGNEKRVSQMFLDNLRRFASGQALHHVVR